MQKEDGADGVCAGIPTTEIGGEDLVIEEATRPTERVSDIGEEGEKRVKFNLGEEDHPAERSGPLETEDQGSRVPGLVTVTVPEATERFEVAKESVKYYQGEEAGASACNSLAKEAVRGFDIEDAECAHVERVSTVVGAVGVNEEDPEVHTNEGTEEIAGSAGPEGRYRRLFTDEELDLLEKGGDANAKEELDEYDKEMEERLFPLDENSVQARVLENARRPAKPSLEELSTELGIPVETLARTQHVSSGEMLSPEFWLQWYAQTLETSGEAKRANRDFRRSEPSKPEAPTPVKAVAVIVSETAEKGTCQESTQGEDDSSERPREVERNVCVRLDEISVPAQRGVSYNQGTPPLRWRSLIRERIYAGLKESVDEPAENTKGNLQEGGGEDFDEEVPPVRDKPVRWDVEKLRSCLEPLVGASNEAFLTQALQWAEAYLEEEESDILEKLKSRSSRRSESVAAMDGSEKERATKPPLGSRKTADPFETQEESLGVYSVNALRTPKPRRRPGLRVFDPEEPPEDDERVVPLGKRVICSISGMQALSNGFVDGCPTEILADTGAIASLVEERVLRRVGRSLNSLRPYYGSLDSVSGHEIRIKGVVDLPVRMGSLEKTLPLVVADRLPVEVILGTDSLKAFRAVIDIEEQTMTLKETGERLPLGETRVEETYAASMLNKVRLEPGHQALVRSRICGLVPSKSVVMVEGVPGADDSLRVARTLCTVTEDQVLVEVCNASPEMIEIEERSLIATVTIIPDSAFKRTDEVVDGERNRDISTVLSTTTESASSSESIDNDEMVAAFAGNADADFVVDFEDSSLAAEQRALFTDMLKDFRDMFVETSKKPGRTDLLSFRIDTGTHPPIKQQPYRVSKAEGDVMEAEIQEYLSLGLIRPSVSPWASPVLMIRKPDGGIRFCIDYRRLNAVTVKDCYPMPLIDDILDVLGNAKLFSTMDIASGYWNVPMDPDSVEKTAFTSKFGLYEWLVMPFGLCNAVPAFERLMENVLVDLKWRTCLVYLDDCVVFSGDFPTHLVRLRQVLGRFRSAGFKLKMKKCHWGRDQVAFLGHIVTPSGILPNPEKVKAVMNIEKPHDLHTVRAFLGLTSYFRRYIPGFAAIAAPLERLKQKEVGFRWDEDCDAAFTQLQRALVKPPILIYPDFSKRFKLYVDSSHLAVGACLMQEVAGRDRAVAYASKMLVGSQRNWVNKNSGTSEIECWGIVWATRKFRCYLDHVEFDLYTDHQALTWIFSENTRTSNAKLARWAMELSQLRFKVFHKPGTAMGHADGLSRLSHRPDRAVISVIRMSDLLNEGEPEDGLNEPVGTPLGPGVPTSDDTSVRFEVGEPGVPTEEDDASPGEPLTQEEQEEDLQGRVVNPIPSAVDAFGLDGEKFAAEQDLTPWMRALKAFLLDGALAFDPQLRVSVLKMAPHFVMKNGLLMRRVHLGARAGPARTILVPAVPIPFIETVLHYCHADIFSAHLGKTKTVDKVRRHAYWHGWKKDAVEYVRECPICGGGKGHRPWRAGLMQRMPIQDLSGPFSLLVVDAIGPLVTTPRGNKYILVFVDYFTRWVEASAVASLDTLSFVDALIEGVICRHGVPEKLLSDRGSNFISHLAKSLYDTLGIKKLFGAAYHPQTQGLVERFNGTLLGMLRMFVNETQTDWDVYLPRVLFAYRTAYHEALGDTPFFSLYGRDPVLPLDLAFLNTGKDWKSNEVAAYRRKLYSSLRDSRRLVERQLIKAQDRHEKRLEGQAKVSYAEGDAVWVYQFFRARRGERKTKKLAFSWHGPYRIVGQVGENAYKVAIPSHPSKIVTINVNRLKRFRGKWSRPFADEVPAGVEGNATGAESDGPLGEEDLPRTSFVERLSIGDEETAFSNVASPIVDIVAKRTENRRVEYLALTATYETFWLSRAALTPDHETLVRAFENADRKKKGLPELRRSARLEEANAGVDDDEVLF